MVNWDKKIDAMNLIVGDIESIKTFYREVFDLTPTGEEDDLAIYRFGGMFIALRSDPAHQPSTEDAAALVRRGVGQFAISVPDVDAVAADLGRRGVSLTGGPVDLPWGIRSATFADPAGYVWEVSQDLG